MPKNVLVTGATGQQGGATINALLASPNAKDFTILAVTRNAASASAKKLEERGVKIVQGNLNDVAGIFTAAAKVSSEPIWGVFSVQVPVGNGASVQTEEKQGKDLVDAALANNVKVFVYTSVDRGGDEKSYDNPTPIPHFISKYNIEHHLVEKAGDKMGWTILRPTAFMDNAQPGFFGKVFPTAWKAALTRPLQIIASKDIGHFGAAAFIDPAKYNHRGIGLAGDELSFADANGVVKEKTGQEFPLTYEFFVQVLLWLVGDLGTMFKWFESDGYGVDIKKLKAEHPGLLNFGEFLETEGKYDLKKTN